MPYPEWEGGNLHLMANVLGHLNLGEPDKQIKAAFRGLTHAQSREGTGGSHKEWNTFLIVLST